MAGLARALVFGLFYRDNDRLRPDGAATAPRRVHTERATTPQSQSNGGWVTFAATRGEP
jgi:hypothetical protein